jgi:hypothetical protein
VSVGLLDVNVLLALAWPNHQHHGQAHAWFAAHSKKGWATCASTQLGFVRPSSNPSYAPEPVSAQDAATLLREWTRHPARRFWASPGAEDPAIHAHVSGHPQVNDAWLVAAARINAGRLVTLDSRLAAHSLADGLVEIIGR